MAKKQLSFKRLQIDKANTMMVIAIAVAAFVVVFSLIASRALFVKRGFQGRIIAEKEVAVKQLRENIDTVDSLLVSYRTFVETPDNIIGGNPGGSGERDGDNAKIVLDALPSKYDFPALATSLEKILKGRSSTINSITGTDDEIAQSTAESLDNIPIEMPFELSATGSLKSVNDLLGAFEASIRPLYIKTVQLSGSNSELQITVTATSYFQPEKTLDYKTKVVQ